MLNLFNLKGLLLSGVAMFAVGSFSGWYVEREIARAAYSELELGYVNGEKKAIMTAVAEERADAAVALKNARDLAAKDLARAVGTQKRLTEVTRYVNKDRPCITVGFVRMHDAAVHGIDPADLALDATELDDTCSTLDSVAVAQAIVRNYDSCRANADQLDALIDLTRKRETIPSPGP